MQMGHDKDALSQAALRDSEDRIWHLEQKVWTAQSDLVRALRTSHGYKQTAEELQERVSNMEALLADRERSVEQLQAELKTASAATVSMWENRQQDGHTDPFSQHTPQYAQVSVFPLYITPFLPRCAVSVSRFVCAAACRSVCLS
jgi:hypothetical protein